MSACIYEKLSNGRLKGVAVEGLFPPTNYQIRYRRERYSRARFIEKVLNSEILEAEEGSWGKLVKLEKLFSYRMHSKILE